MKTILLTSSGTKFLVDEILKILPKPPTELKLANVITASKPEKNQAYVADQLKKLEDMGFQVRDLDIEGQDEESLRNFLADTNVIFVQGGNTFYLLKATKESSFDKVVKEAIEREVVYIGVSAGSMICGPTIETAGWKGMDNNIVGLKDLTALNLVPFNLFVHYTPDQAEVIRHSHPSSKYPMTILSDEQAVLVQDGKTKFIGSGKRITV